jgi:predicted RNase H-like HicB family nuclease
VARELPLVRKTPVNPPSNRAKIGALERYAVLIHDDPEGGFWAEVHALQGCYSQGEIVDELMANVREAITGLLEVMKEHGKCPESNIQIVDIAVDVSLG